MNESKKKLIRVTTVPVSLEKLLENQLDFMNNYFEVIGVSSDEKHLAEIGRNQNIKVYPVDMSRVISPIQDFKSLVKMYFFLKREKPFIIHTHTPKAGVVGILAGYLAGVPHRLHTVAGLPLMEVTGVKRDILNFVEKITYSCATKVYPNSFGLKDIILDHNFTTSDKLKVIGNGSSNGINLDKFNSKHFSEEDNKALKKTLNIKDSDFVFIFVGRVVGDKGVNELINAFDFLNKKNSDIKLIMVGPFERDLDPLKTKTEEIIKNNNSIILVGYQQDVRPYFSISDVLVFPSYREGFPNVVMQAGAMGLPSIVSNINGCNEIITENKNGWIIPVKDELKLKEAMENCLLDKNSFNFAKQNARKTITDNYDQKLVWKAILNEYQSIDN